MAKKSSKLTAIKAGSQLTIDSAPVIYKAVLDSLKHKQNILIETETIEEIDLAGIQLLEFTIKAAKNEDVSLNLKTKFSQNIKALLNSTGFGHLVVSG